MRRNSLRSTISPSIRQKIRLPQHLLRLKDEKDGFDNDENDRFRLPSLSQQKSLENDNNDILSNQNSAATSVSWSQEVENTATQKLEEQWTIVERSFYEEDDQSLQGAVLDECIHWRTQISYLRIIGKNPVCFNNSSVKREIGSGEKRMRKSDNTQHNEVFAEHSLSTKEGEDSMKYKSNKAKFEEILDMLTEYIISQLFLDDDNKTDSLQKSLNDTLKIAPAPIHNNRNSSRNLKTNWIEEAISPNYIENKSLSIKNRLLDTENFMQTKNGPNYQKIQKTQRNSVSANKLRDFGDTGDDDVSKTKERLCTPHIGRNKLGTIFNERIIVSPVPFVVSTRESFSTLKTVPIRFMNEDLEISSFQGSARNISGFRNSAKRPSVLRNSNIHSAWQAPVCPTVWPKNIRLAPIETSRVSINKNRSLAPSPTVYGNRKPLSPISRSTMPKSAYATRDRKSDLLEIQGKHIVPTQSKISLLSTGWNYSPRIPKNKKKGSRAKEGH